MRVIYIDIDSCRPDHLGCYGYGRNTSPNIDQIASDGVRFNQVYASDVPCLPSRTALFGGRLGLHSGVNGHGGTAAHMRYPGDGHATNPDKLPLPMALSRGGVQTITFTTFAQRHLAWHFYAGWNEIHRFANTNGGETADQVNAAVIPWLETFGRADNYFLHINYWDPHTPYRTPLGWETPFADVPPPAWPPPETIEQQRASYGIHGAFDLPAHDRNRFPRVLPEIRDRADFNKWIDGYDTGIHYVDHYVGELIAVLDRLKLLDDTAIVVSADHGEAQGELNVYGDHACADEATCHIPLIVRWPGKARGAQCDALLYQLDLAPTLCDLLGVPVPSGWDGASFAPAIDGQRAPGRSSLVLTQGAWTCQRAVRRDNWLAIRTYHTGLRPFPEVMLFDLADDPHETTDVARQHSEVVAELDRTLGEWWQRNLADGDAAPDPLLTIMQEGGPWYVRNRLDEYVKRLRETGREPAVEELSRLRGRPIPSNVPAESGTPSP